MIHQSKPHLRNIRCSICCFFLYSVFLCFCYAFSIAFFSVFFFSFLLPHSIEIYWWRPSFSCAFELCVDDTKKPNFVRRFAISYTSIRAEKSVTTGEWLINNGRAACNACTDQQAQQQRKTWKYNRNKNIVYENKIENKNEEKVNNVFTQSLK